jgi:hypothetical protein
MQYVQRKHNHRPLIDPLEDRRSMVPPFRLLLMVKHHAIYHAIPSANMALTIKQCLSAFVSLISFS